MFVPVVYHPDYYSDIGDHVFPTEKFALIYEELKKQVEDFEPHVQRPSPASREQVSRVHTRAYLDDLDGDQHTFRTYPAELPLTKQIVAAYYLMTGGTCLAAQQALEHGCALNLGGGFHHAFADRAEGFCYINDVAVAIREVMAADRGKRVVERAAVIDVDLHQGNGTAHIFLSDPRVFTFSIHQENNYPVKQKSDVDIGLVDGVGDEEYLSRLEEALKTIFSGFRPEFVVYVGGVDPYEQDQLGGLRLTKEGVRKRDSMVFTYCRENRVPVTAVLAGGYARQVRDTVEMHVNTGLELDSVFG